MEEPQAPERLWLQYHSLCDACVATVTNRKFSNIKKKIFQEVLEKSNKRNYMGEKDMQNSILFHCVPNQDFLLVSIKKYKVKSSILVLPAGCCLVCMVAL